MESFDVTQLPSLDPGFGPFSIVQAAVAAAIGLGVAYSWFRGEKGKGRTGKFVEGGGVQMFFGGPLEKALGFLEGLYRVMGEMRTENKETVAEFRTRHEEELNLLREISEAARDKESITLLRNIADAAVIGGQRDADTAAQRRRKRRR